MKRLLFIVFLFISLFSMGQATYNPTTGTVSNKPYSPAQAVPTDSRSYKYDSINFLWRPYQNTSEVLSYLNLAKYRAGNFIIVVDSGGTLQSNGTFLTPTNTFWMFKDSTGNGGLVKLNLLGSSGCSTCFQIANNLDEGNPALIKGTLSLDNVDNTSDATKNAATATLTNKTISGSSNTFTNIPNSALANNSIGLTLNSTGSTPAVTTSPAALGTSLVLSVPNGSGSNDGFILHTDWGKFHAKVDSTTESGDTVYDWYNGTATFRYVIPAGTGAVLSVANSDGTINFSPTTGNVIGSVNQAANFTWTGTHIFTGAPTFSSLTTNGGVFYGNGSGTLQQSPVGTNGQIFESQGASGPIFFSPNAATVNGWLGYTPLSSALGSTHIFVGNGSNVATDVAMSGDATLANTGALTIGNNKVTYAKIQAAAGQGLMGATGAGNFGLIALGTNLSMSGSTLNAAGGSSSISLASIVKYASIAPLPINTYAGGVITSTTVDTLQLDGYIPALGDTVLIQNEATTTKNGIYTVTQLATPSLPFTLTRLSGADLNGGSSVSVQLGAVNGGTTFYQQTPGAITLGTTALSYLKGKNYQDLGIPPNNFNTQYFGNSITFGYCPACAGSVEVPWPNQLQDYFGNTVTNNLAVSNTGAKFSYGALAGVRPSQQGPILGEAAFNNVRIPITGDTLHAFSMIKSAYRAMAALQFLDTTRLQFVFTGNAGSLNSNVTLSQACGFCQAASLDSLSDYNSILLNYRSNIAGYAGANWWKKPSITANETITWTNIKGPGIVIGTWADSTGGSRIQVTVDGSVVTTYNPNNRTTPHLNDQTYQNLQIMNDAIVILGLQDTLHTVVLTFLDGGAMGGLDYISGIKTPTASYGAPFYVLDVPLMGTAGYLTPGGLTSAATLDSCTNSRWTDITNTFPGYPIYRVPINYPMGYYNAMTMTQSDGVHPTEIGQAALAKSIISSINPKFVGTASSTSSGVPLNLVNVGTIGVATTTSGVPTIGLTDVVGNPLDFWIGIYSNSPSGRPEIIMSAKSASTDNKVWDEYTDGQNLYERAVNDANSAASNYWHVNRTGTTINYQYFGGAAIGYGTVTTPSYLLDASTGSIVSAFHLSSSTSDDGLYITPSTGTYSAISFGSAFNGSNWVAKTTTATSIGGSNKFGAGNNSLGSFAIYADSLLTSGSTFSPTERLTVGPTGKIYIDTPPDSVAVPAGGVLYRDAATGKVELGPAGSGVTTVGSFSGSGQTNGASISGSTITFGPATASLPGMITTGTQTIAGNKLLSGTLDIGGASAGLGPALILDGNTTSSTATSTIGFWLTMARGNTHTETSSGTLALGASAFIGDGTFAAGSATTYTNAATLLINAAPTAGTNVTLTNKWALYVAAGNSLFNGNISGNVNAISTFTHFVGNNVATIAAGAGAGSSPTVAITGTDQDGIITVTTGATPSTSSTVATITYALAFGTNSFPVLTPANAATALLNGTNMVYTTGSTTGFTITSGTVGLTTLTGYSWYYHCGGIN